MQKIRKIKENRKREKNERKKKNIKGPGETFPAQTRSQPAAHPGFLNWPSLFSC
jgi:hypothetical protein